jgi:hypothetical protein
MMTIFNMLKGTTYLREAEGGAGGGATPWYQGMTGVDEGAITSITAKGWDKLPLNEAVPHILQSWRSAESMVGTPAEQLLRLPKDQTNPVEWDPVWSRLGKPATADKYDLSTVKRADGTDLDPSVVGQVQALAHKLNLPANRAADLASAIVGLNDATAASQKAEKDAAVAAERTALEQNWGANAAANKIVAQNAARALGVEPAQIEALEGVIGYAKVMEMFRTIGSKIGEDKYVAAGSQGSGGVISRDQAVARVTELKKDTAWVGRYLAGGSEEGREMQSLNKIISGT